MEKIERPRSLLRDNPNLRWDRFGEAGFAAVDGFGECSAATKLMFSGTSSRGVKDVEADRNPKSTPSSPGSRPGDEGHYRRRWAIYAWALNVTVLGCSFAPSFPNRFREVRPVPFAGGCRSLRGQGD